MKKKILIFISIIMSFILSINAVKAQATMAVVCNVTVANCIKCSDDNYDEVFFIATKELGGSSIVTANSKAFLGEHFEINSDGCWINDENDIEKRCTSEDKIGLEAAVEKMQQGVCPAAMRNDYTFDDVIVFAGTSKPLKQSILTENEWRIYTDKEGKIFIEGYFIDGKYAYINAVGNDSSQERQIASISRNGVDFWQVAHNPTTLGNYPSIEEAIRKRLKTEGKSNEEINNIVTADYVSNVIDEFTIEDSLGSKGLIKESAKEWYTAENKKYAELNSTLSELINDEEFITECKNIKEAADNNKKYKFSSKLSEEDRQDFIDKLSSSLEIIQNANEVEFTDYATCQDSNENITPLASAISYFWANKLGSCTGDTEDISSNALNPTLIHDMIATSLEKEIKNLSAEDEDAVDVLNLDDTLDYYTNLFLTSTAYINKWHDELGFTDSQTEEIKDLLNDYEEYGSERNIFVVLDCTGLLGQELVDKINSYLNIIKIVIPLILIVLGVIDFTKAIFAGDSEQMTKAKQNFIKRIGIAVLIFLVPTILNLILSLANNVWNFIDPSGCGIN